MAATLHAADVATPVKIRDLSAAGAQVETSLLPAVGTPVTLSRGRLRIQGHVTWCTERRCGLHFSSQISVQDWMTNPVNHEQRRVDRAVAVVKSGAAPLPAAAAGREARPVLPMADDLRQFPACSSCSAMRWPAIPRSSPSMAPSCKVSTSPSRR